jgi:ribonuclease BN (tRNA processing enzyme)
VRRFSVTLPLGSALARVAPTRNRPSSQTALWPTLSGFEFLSPATLSNPTSLFDLPGGLVTLRTSHCYLPVRYGGLSVIDRRGFLATALAAAAVAPGRIAAQSGRTNLILLGTGGGPRPRKASSAAAQVIVTNNVAYVIDCGNGVARQLAFAAVPLTILRHIFITHQHSDHNADYGNLIWLAWAAGLSTRVDTWGPPPLEKMTKLFFEMNAYDIEARISNEARVPLAPLVHVHEIRDGGVVMRDDDVKVTAALVDHPPVVPAFGYRFDTHDRSIVISGDTAPSDNLVKLARGADVLVHSVMYPAAVDRLVRRVPNAAALKDSILAHQTSAEDAGRIAERAGVKVLVLSHFVPADDPEVTEQMWIQAAQSRFRGTVILGKDLLEI